MHVTDDDIRKLALKLVETFSYRDPRQDGLSATGRLRGRCIRFPSMRWVSLSRRWQKPSRTRWKQHSGRWHRSPSTWTQTRYRCSSMPNQPRQRNPRLRFQFSRTPRGRGSKDRPHAIRCRLRTGYRATGPFIRIPHHVGQRSAAARQRSATAVRCDLPPCGNVQGLRRRTPGASVLPHPRGMRFSRVHRPADCSGVPQCSSQCAAATGMGKGRCARSERRPRIKKNGLGAYARPIRSS